METLPSAQSSLHKLNFGNISQKILKSRYQSPVVLSNSTGFLYSATNILDLITFTEKADNYVFDHIC